MRIAFCGVTGWGNASLARLLEADVEVWRVFARTEHGPCPHYPVQDLAAFASERGCRVVLDAAPGQDPARLMDLRSAQIDVLVSCGYHRKIGTAALACAPYAINLHPSLLPHYRGSAPSNWSIIHGEAETGVSLHSMTSRFDAGDIILQRRMSIGADETAGALRLRQAYAMSDILMEFVDRLRSRTLPAGIKQDDAAASYYRAITRADAQIDPRCSVRSIIDVVRGTTPWPGPWLALDGMARAIRAAAPIDAPSAPAGTVLALEAEAVTIAATDGAVRYTLDEAASLSHNA